MPGTILVIEDEPAIAETLTYALTTDGFSAEWCATGRDALAALSSGRPYDLAIMDIGLPDVNGFELFRHVQSAFAIPVIFLTARSEEVDRVVGLELGADDYISKPFSPREVCARVRTVLRRVKREQERTQEQGRESKLDSPVAANALSPFLVDDERKRIHYCGIPLELSRIEYRLLKTIAERPGRVYSREELMASAWEHPQASLDRTVDAHVKQIRAKLKAILPHADPIRTHRGIGYSLKEQA